MAKRVAELVGLVGKALLFLLIDLALGLAGIVQAVRGAHTSAYLLGIATALLLATIFGWVAYKALYERDLAIAQPISEGASKGDTHIHAEAGSTVIVNQPPGESTS